MDKGIKILQKHVKKIEESNNLILERTLSHAFKLKNTRLSDISYKKTQTFEILIHKDTNNFPAVKQKLLAKIADLHVQYPFITLSFDPSPELQPGLVRNPASSTMPTNVNVPINPTRATPSQNDNRLILTVNWEDYVRHSLKGIEGEQLLMNMPRLGIEDQMNEIKRKNAETLRDALDHMLRTANQHTLDEKSDLRINLQNNTMSYEVTRNHLSHISQQIMRHYNGMVEIFNNNASMITIRVHWNVYLSQMAALEHQQRQIPLLSGTDSSFDRLGPVAPQIMLSHQPFRTASVASTSTSSSATNAFNKSLSHEQYLTPAMSSAPQLNPGLYANNSQGQDDSSEPEYVKEYQKQRREHRERSKRHRKIRAHHSHSSRDSGFVPTKSSTNKVSPRKREEQRGDTIEFSKSDSKVVSPNREKTVDRSQNRERTKASLKRSQTEPAIRKHVSFRDDKPQQQQPQPQPQPRPRPRPRPQGSISRSQTQTGDRHGVSPKTQKAQTLASSGSVTIELK